jgi:hypothetical protein
MPPECLSTKLVIAVNFFGVKVVELISVAVAYSEL